MNIMQENKILANDVLERHFYSQLRQKGSSKNIEIFLTGACRSNCEYCYLKKHMNNLYPIELQNSDIIIQNVKYILEWYVEQKFQTNIQIFSAEWLTSPLADKIFDIFYEVFKDSEYKPPVLLCADNMQFLKDENLTAKVESYIERMKSIDIGLVLSASVDGKYCDFGRTPNSPEFYEKLKHFMQKYSFLPHPMLSATNVKYWIDNFHWWKENFGLRTVYDMTFLEVRNEQWDKESIQNLIQFCDYLTDETYKALNNNKEEMLKYVFNLHDRKNEDKYHNDAYNPIRLMFNFFTQNKDIISCSFSKNLTIRAADLTVAPCHRLYYPLLEHGKYNIENGKITDFEPSNISLLIGQKYLKRSCLPICEHCGLVGICPGFCLGSSYEEYRNMLVPQKEVCEMYRIKYAFLIYKYYKMGLFDEKGISFLKSYFDNDEDFHYLLDLINSVLEGDFV